MAKRCRDRVRQRLADLRRRFGPGVGPADLDKDGDRITADDPEHIARRTFFAGEVFWVGRPAWQACGGFGTNPTRTHHPGLVVRKIANPCLPVDMVPGTSKPRELLDGGRQAHLFCPSEDPRWVFPGDEHPDLQVYVLDYWRPVARGHISHHLCNLRFLDLQKLQGEMRDLYGDAYRGGRA